LSTRDPILVWTWTCLLGMCGTIVAALRAALAFDGVPGPGDQCGALGSDPDFVRVAIRTFPPSARCVFQHHPSFELVPSWVTPVLVVCLAAMVIGGVAAVWCALRNALRKLRKRNPTRQRSVSDDA
jgi:hypothetical protein